jgi:hypothetical protein
VSQLRELIARLDSFEDDDTIYAAKASPTALAAVGRELENGGAPPEAAGLQYLLEVALAKEAVQVWSEWRNGAAPTLDDKVAAVIHYATHDRYLPVARHALEKDPLHGLRVAKVYGRGEKYVVTSSSRWRYGAFTSPPYFVVQRRARDDELGEAVIDAIEGFTLLADEKDLNDQTASAALAELFALVGVKNYQTFERGSSLVNVEVRRRRWTIQPYGRQRGYWARLHERTYLNLSAPSASEVGAAVRDAFITLRGRP